MMKNRIAGAFLNRRGKKWERPLRSGFEAGPFFFILFALPYGKGALKYPIHFRLGLEIFGFAGERGFKHDRRKGKKSALHYTGHLRTGTFSIHPRAVTLWSSLSAQDR